jgi:hypothetical protein
MEQVSRNLGIAKIQGIMLKPMTDIEKYIAMCKDSEIMAYAIDIVIDFGNRSSDVQQALKMLRGELSPQQSLDLMPKFHSRRGQ